MRTQLGDLDSDSINAGDDVIIPNLNLGTYNFAISFNSLKPMPKP